MTGYLRRLIDRHRADPALRLRAAARFEGDHAAGILTADDERPAIPAAPSGRPRTADGGDARHGTSRPPPAVDAPRPSPRATRALEADRPAGDGHTQPGSSTTVAMPPVVYPLPVPDLVGRSDPDAPAPLFGASPDPADQPRLVRATLRHAEPSRFEGDGRGRTAERAERSASAGPRQATRAAGHAEPDVVHVHIGRVEVRAPTTRAEPQPPPARPARPRPMSLDSYLSAERRP